MNTYNILSSRIIKNYNKLALYGKNNKNNKITNENNCNYC